MTERCKWCWPRPPLCTPAVEPICKKRKRFIKYEEMFKKEESDVKETMGVRPDSPEG